MILFAALGAASAALGSTSLLLRAVAGPRGVAGRLLFLWLLAYAEVVLVSEVLSELRLIGAAGYLAGHVVLGLAAYAGWRRAGSPPLLVPAREAAAAVLRFVKGHRGASLFAGIVGVLSVVNLAFPFLYPILNGDANAYHLPRAYYWTTLGTARHFPAADFRMNEMPPDPSFVYAWILSLSGSFSS